MIKILVVDDSAFMRKIISESLMKLPIDVSIETARNGHEAIEKVASSKPDIMTLDVEMPVMGGLEALKQIMDKYPLPVIMLSSLTKEGAETTITALELGAIDFIPKPSTMLNFDFFSFEKEIQEKILQLKSCNINPIQSNRIKKSNIVKHLNHKNPIIAIGTSTGGPKALQHILTALPANLPASILVVQHMPQGFTLSLAERLDKLCSLKIKEATDGDIISPGTVYIAPGGYHMEIEVIKNNYKITLNQKPPVLNHRPSVNVLMESLYNNKITEVIAIILTGMGTDGTDGIKKLKTLNGPIVVTQNKESSVVFGMPKSIIENNLSDYTLDINEISNFIINTLQRGD